VLGGVCTLFYPPLPPPGVPEAIPGAFSSFLVNPARSRPAQIAFGLPVADRVEARVYDLSGRLVRSLAHRRFPAGWHTLTWDGMNDSGERMQRGIYFTRIQLENGTTETKKLTLLAP
jgi:hypothetical protein